MVLGKIRIRESPILVISKISKKKQFHKRIYGHKDDFLKIAKKSTTTTILILWIFSPSLVKWLYINVGKLLIFSHNHMFWFSKKLNSRSKLVFTFTKKTIPCPVLYFYFSLCPISYFPTSF